MKKKVMSKEVLEGMYAGTKLEENAGETAAEEVGEVGAEVAEELTAKETLEPTAEEVILADVQASLKEKTEALEVMTTEFEVAKELAAEKAMATDALIAELTTVLTEQVARFRTALDLAEVDMKDMNTSAVLKEFKSMEAKFMKTLPSGEVTPAASVAKEEVEPVATITDKAAYASLGFNE